MKHGHGKPLKDQSTSLRSKDLDNEIPNERPHYLDIGNWMRYQRLVYIKFS